MLIRKKWLVVAGAASVSLIAVAVCIAGTTVYGEMACRPAVEMNPIFPPGSCNWVSIPSVGVFCRDANDPPTCGVTVYTSYMDGICYDQENITCTLNSATLLTTTGCEGSCTGTYPVSCGCGFTVISPPLHGTAIAADCY